MILVIPSYLQIDEKGVYFTTALAKWVDDERRHISMAEKEMRVVGEEAVVTEDSLELKASSR